MWGVGAVVTGMAGKTGFWGFFDAILAEFLGFRAVFCKYGSRQKNQQNFIAISLKKCNFASRLLSTLA
jgi:hypothetical protein